MSGTVLKYAAALSLSAFLAACGGDDNSTPLAEGGSSGGGGGNTNAGDGNNGNNNPATAQLELGTGEGGNFQSGQMKVTASNLSSGGTTRISFNVVNAANGNELYTTEQTSVSITSTCDAATIDSPQTTNSGVIETTYQAGCSGQQTITASVDNGATATSVIDVAPQKIGAMTFESVSPSSLALDGNADTSRLSVSEVTFALVDDANNPVSDKKVSFSLSTDVGGLSLNADEATTGPDGKVTALVQAGSVPATVTVIASTTAPDGEIFSTTSDPISISSSIPDQDSISLAVDDNFLPNAWDHDGETVEMTLSAGDRNNNPVSNAIANFVTSGGYVTNECTVQSGVCTVTWTSGNPRPDSGVVQVLARSVGEESFNDGNSDGVFKQTDDTFVTKSDRGEAFLDRNNNNIFDPTTDSYYDYNGNGQYDSPNGQYNGAVCADNSCSEDLIEVRDDVAIFMASDNIVTTITSGITAPPNSTVDLTGGSSKEVCAEIGGEIANSQIGPPPGETSVTFSTTNGEITTKSEITTTVDFRTQPIEACVTLSPDDTLGESGTLSIEVAPPAPYTGDPFITEVAVDD